MDYIAYLHKDRKSDFGVSFPDVPGCVTAGKSLEEARRKAPEALAFHIAVMVEDGEKIPKPSKRDDLAGDPNRENAAAFLVTTDFNKTKTVRVNITARENQIEMIDRLARRAGMTRSAYMVQSATSGVAFKKRSGSARRRINAHAKRVKSAKSRTALGEVSGNLRKDRTFENQAPKERVGGEHHLTSSC